MIQICNTPSGYVVEAFFRPSWSKYHSWLPLRNFGANQSDAIEFAQEAETLPVEELDKMNKRYSTYRVYRKQGKRYVCTVNKDL